MAKKKTEEKEFKMNGAEFKKALDNIVAEKNIDPEIVYSAMELALTSAYKKNFNSKTNVKVVFDVILALIAIAIVVLVVIFVKRYRALDAKAAKK